MACKWFHCTSTSKLESIAFRGLLNPRMLDLIGKKVNHPDHSKPGCVYVLDHFEEPRNENNFVDGWFYYAMEEFDSIRGEPITLCIHNVEPNRRDENFRASNDSWLYSWQRGAYEIDGYVVPENVFVHNPDGECIPIREFVRSEAYV